MPSPRLYILYALELSLSYFATGLAREKRATLADSGCNNMSQFIGPSDAQNYHVTLETKSFSSCEKWAENTTKGLPDECVSGLTWCLNMYTDNYYAVIHLHGSCNHSRQLTYVYEAKAYDWQSRQTNHTPLHSSHDVGPPNPTCWENTVIRKDCTGPDRIKTLNSFCVSHSSPPIPSPLGPVGVAIWLPVVVAVAASVLLVLSVTGCIIVRRRRRRRIPPQYDPVAGEDDVTPPHSFLRQQGPGMAVMGAGCDSGLLQPPARYNDLSGSKGAGERQSLLASTS